MRLHNSACKELTLEVLANAAAAAVVAAIIFRHHHPTDPLPPMPRLLPHLAKGRQDPGPHNPSWLCRCAAHAQRNIIHRYSPLAAAMSLPAAYPGQASEICPPVRHRQQKSAKRCEVKPRPQGKTQQQQQRHPERTAYDLHMTMAEPMQPGVHTSGIALLANLHHGGAW